MALEVAVASDKRLTLSGFPSLQLLSDSTGEESAKLLSEVFRRMCANQMWHETARLLLQGIDEVSAIQGMAVVHVSTWLGLRRHDIESFYSCVIMHRSCTVCSVGSILNALICR